MRTLTISLFFLWSTQLLHAQYNYAEVLQKSMFFYEAQQSGSLDSSNRVSWRSNSALTDGSDVGHDLTGGWYDAGDHVKFGFPMAFSATMLAWGGIEFEAGYEASGQMDYLKKNLRWVNDYFIKCHTAANEFWGQVGNGGTDHAWWGSAEVMQMTRPAYKIDATSPGSDLAAETAAAMAAASILFQEDDATYSATLLAHAEALYSFADTYRGVYSSSITDAGSYYNSYSGYQDELVWGALWLYLATEDQDYLDKAISYYSNLSTEGQTGLKSYKWGLAWDDKSYGCYTLLAKITGNATYKADIERHLDYWTDGYNGERVNYTSGGLAYLDVWGALRYSLNTSFLALVYAPYATSTTKGDTYYGFAVSQMDYALGNNPLGSSYVCGYGTNPPVNPHHRTAHGCWSNNQNGPPVTTRHTLYGALVGGPNSDDSYSDVRSNYINNEVACDYNAGFSGVLAKLVEDFGGSPLANFPQEETPAGEFLIESKLNGSGTTYTEWSVWMYNHTAWPARFADTYQFRLFVDISEGLAAGYSVADYVVTTNNSGVATFTNLIAWDAEENIYYTEVTLNADVLLWPGGQGESQEEVQMRIRLPYEASAAAWDPANDWSYQGLTSTLAENPNIPFYVDGVLVYGSEPSSGDPVAVTGISVSPSATSLNLNQTQQLTATISPANATNKSITWSTSNNAVATVSSSGLITGIGEGSATITATSADGGFTANCAVTVTNVVISEFTLAASVSGSGSISLSPAGGIYDSATVVTVTATAASGYQFDSWSGDLSGTTNPISVTVNSNMSITANFTESPATCSAYTAITLPFSQDGSGDYCWVTSGSVSYINSWNLSTLEINGQDFTNTWSNSMPARIDGNYYIYYSGPYAWSHVEISGSNARLAPSTDDASDEILIYPNPASDALQVHGLTPYSRLQLMDLSGKIIFTQHLKKISETTLSVAKLPSGVYLLRLSGEQGDVTRQISIKQ